MNKKYIAAVITFAVTFGFSAFLMSFFKTSAPRVQTVRFTDSAETGAKIQQLLEQDIRNGQNRNRELSVSGYEYDFSLYAEAVNDYADASASMDDSDLPRDFQIAWRKHMKAWREKANLLNRKTNSDSAALNFDEFYELKNDEINETWYEVLGVAGRYGAFPANAY